MSSFSPFFIAQGEKKAHHGSSLPSYRGYALPVMREWARKRERLFFFFFINTSCEFHIQSLTRNTWKEKQTNKQTNKKRQYVIFFYLFLWIHVSFFFFLYVCMFHVMEKSLGGAFQQRSQEVRVLNGQKKPSVKNTNWYYSEK